MTNPQDLSSSQASVALTGQGPNLLEPQDLEVAEFPKLRTTHAAF